MENYQLSEGCLRLIMNEQIVEDPVVQVLGIRKIQTSTSSSNDRERYRILLSDGLNSISFAMISMQANSGAIENFSVIKLKKYLTSVINNAATGDKKILFILEKEMVVDGRKIGKSIGEPRPLDDKAISKSTSNGASSSISSLAKTAKKCFSTDRVVKKAKMENYQLSKGCLRLIMSEQKVEDPVVQVLGIRKIKTSSSDWDRYRILLSDGLNSISFAMISMQANSGVIENFSVIKLKKYVTGVINNAATGDKKVLLILEKEMVVDGCKIGKSIGQPKPLDDRTIFKSTSNDTSSSISSLVNDRPVSPPNPINQSVSEDKVIILILIIILFINASIPRYLHLPQKRKFGGD